MGQGGSRFRHLKRENPGLAWLIIDELGSGSYGKVHLVRNRKTNVLAAAKVAPLQREAQLDTFLTEVNILVSCRHTNVTNFVGGYYHDNTLWILIEVCTGGSLAEVLRKQGTGLQEPQIQCATFQVLRALDFLHGHLVIHRDLNASNLLLAEGGLIKLADFGVSAMCKGETRRSSFIGSPNWMAPEVIACEKDRSRVYGTAVDIWSLGATLIELAETKAPYHDLHPVKVLFKIANSPPPTLSSPELWSPMFSELLKSAMEKDPRARPSAAKLLLHPFCRDHSSVGSLVSLHRRALELVCMGLIVKRRLLGIIVDCM